MASKSKRETKYTRADLDLAAKEGKKEIFEDLSEIVKSGQRMSMAEAELGCSYLAMINRDDANFDLASFPICEPHIFINLYIRYWNDLEGKYGIEKAAIKKEDRHVSTKEKEKDVAKLDSIYRKWETTMTINHHKRNPVLNMVVNETKLWLDEMETRSIDYRERPYKIKATKLNSKYVYLTVREFFEEHGGDVVIVNYNGEEIEIDMESVIHIMIRHFAGASKQFDMNKSFHLDKQIRWRYLAYDLKALLERISKSKALFGQDFNRISFKFNERLYTVRTEKKSKNVKGKLFTIHRLGTFYPIKLHSEIETLKNDYTEIFIDSELSVFKLK